MNSLQILSLTACFLTILSAPGCTGRGGKRPIKSVTVTVTYKGKPVEDATITFISSEPDAPAAYGQTNAQGVAKPATPEIGEGVILGTHKVLVSKEQIVKEKKSAEQESADYVPPPPGGAPVPTVKHLIPEKYSIPGDSPLTAEVTASGPADFKFDLTD